MHYVPPRWSRSEAQVCAKKATILSDESYSNPTWNFISVYFPKDSIKSKMFMIGLKILLLKELPSGKIIEIWTKVNFPVTNINTRWWGLWLLHTKVFGQRQLNSHRLVRIDILPNPYFFRRLLSRRHRSTLSWSGEIWMVCAKERD